MLRALVPIALSSAPAGLFFWDRRGVIDLVSPVRRPIDRGLQPWRPELERSRQLIDQLAALLILQHARLVEPAGRLADHEVGPVDRESIQEHQHLAQVALGVARAEQPPLAPMMATGLPLEGCPADATPSRSHS
jgi:hypothetical protein